MEKPLQYVSHCQLIEGIEKIRKERNMLAVLTVLFLLAFSLMAFNLTQSLQRHNTYLQEHPVAIVEAKPYKEGTVVLTLESVETHQKRSGLFIPVQSF